MTATIHGTFKVVAIEKGEVYLDPYLQGGSTTIDQGANLQVAEVDSDGQAKAFDGFQVGDYFVFNGEFEEVGYSELFAKITIFDTVVSVPLSKVVRL